MRKTHRPARDNDKHKVIAPELVTQGSWLTFSFNPEEQPMFERFYRMKLNNLKDWSQQQYDILTTLRHANVHVILECSPKGRLHFHGVIKINDVIEFYMTDLKKLKHYGAIEIDTIGDDEIWLTYIYKQRKYMKGYADKHEMHYEIYNDDKYLD